MCILVLNEFELLRSWIRPFVVRKVFLGVRWLPQRVGYLGVCMKGMGNGAEDFSQEVHFQRGWADS